MGKIEELFGRDEGISVLDVEKLIQNEVEESSTLEYVAPVDLDELTPWSKEGLIVRPIVGFLNRHERLSSLLILGVGTDSESGHKPRAVVPIDGSILDEEKIRLLIVNSIDSIPEFVSPLSVKVVPVPCRGGGFVFLVEVIETTDAFYYSTITNVSYMRRENVTEQMTMKEAFAFIQSLKVARLRLVPTQIDAGRITGGKTRVDFTMVMENEGMIPGVDVQAYLTFDLEKRAAAEVPSVDVERPAYRDAVDFGAGHFRSFLFASDGMAVYPGLRLPLGRIRLVIPEGTGLTLLVRVFERGGTSSQRFKINANEWVKPQGQPEYSTFGA